MLGYRSHMHNHLSVLRYVSVIDDSSCHIRNRGVSRQVRAGKSPSEQLESIDVFCMMYIG